MKRNLNLKTKKDKQGKILILASSFFIISTFIVGALVEKSSDNELTFCPEVVKKKHIILLDHSSKLRSDSLAHIRLNIDEIISKIGPGEEIEFQAMNQNQPNHTIPFDIAKDMSSICRPVRQYSNKILSEIFENYELKNKTFSQKINDFLNKDYLSKVSEASYSPISTRINNILTLNQNTDVRLHVFSDFMELTREVNVYKCFGLEKVKLKQVDGGIHIYKLPVDSKYKECRNTYLTEISKDKKFHIIEITGESTYAGI